MEGVTKINVGEGVGVEVGVWVDGYISGGLGPVAVNPDILGTCPSPESGGADVTGGLREGAGGLGGEWGEEGSKEEEGEEEFLHWLPLSSSKV